MLHDTVGAASLMANGLSEAINIVWTQKWNGSQCLAFAWPRIAPNYKLIISHIAAQKLVRRITDLLFCVKAAGGKVKNMSKISKKKRSPNTIYTCREKQVCHNIIKLVKSTDFQFYSMFILRMIKVKTQLTFYLLLLLYF